MVPFYTLKDWKLRDDGSIQGHLVGHPEKPDGYFTFTFPVLRFVAHPHGFYAFTDDPPGEGCWRLEGKHDIESIKEHQLELVTLYTLN